MFAVPSFFGYNTTFVSTPVATAATGVGSTSFTANWNAFAGASYYLLDVSTSSSFSSFVGSYQNFVVLSTSQLVSGLTASTTYYYRLRAATGVDADAAAFFSRVYTAGGALSYTEVSATETLVADMKSAGIWTAMRAVYPMIGASAAACAQNLKSSSFTGTFTSGWTFASTGATPNGTSAYFDTNFNVSSNFTANNLSVSGYSRTNTQDGNDRFLFGVQTPNGVWWDNYNNTQRNIGSGSLSITLSGQSGFDGFMLVNTQNSTSTKVIRNLTTLNTTTTLNTGIIPSRNMVFSVLDYGSKAFYDNKQLAFGHLGDGLTDTQASNFYTAVQAFQTTLSRQV